MHPIQHWYPARLRNDKHGLHCEWIELKDIPFADPFFDETLTRGRGKPINSGCFRPTSSIAVLAEWSNALPHVQPTAFVFHVSRCGSTLLSQLLGLHPRSISLAEVPFFDDVLRLPFKASVPSGVDLNRALAAAIAIYGQHRTGDEKHLFIKLDSWHVFFWRQIRACYPDVPFFLLYRPGRMRSFNRTGNCGECMPFRALSSRRFWGFAPTRWTRLIWMDTWSGYWIAISACTFKSPLRIAPPCF